MLGVIRDWLDRRRAFKELHKTQRDISRYYAKFFEADIEAARHALDRKEPGQANEIWVKARVRFPDLAVKSPAALELMLDLARFDEAEQMMREGERLRADQPAFPLGYARVAQRRGDLEEAIHRCETLLHKFPDCAEAYILAADCMDKLKRRDEAEALLGRGARRLPKHFLILQAHATRAEQRGDLEEALRRWQIVRERSDHPPGMLGVARCLMALKRYDEAEKVLAEACESHVTNGYPLISMGRLNALRGNIDEAMRFWKLARGRFPSLLAAYTDAAATALEFGRDAEADEILGEAITRFPYELAPHLTYARVAHRRRNWAAAAERWALTCDRFPDNVEAREKRAEAQAAGR